MCTQCEISGPKKRDCPQLRKDKSISSSENDDTTHKTELTATMRVDIMITRSTTDGADITATDGHDNDINSDDNDED